MPFIPIELDDLDDVDLTTTAPTDGQALVFEAASGTWVPGSAGSATTTTIEEWWVTDGDVMWRWGVDSLGRPYFDYTNGADSGEEARLIVDTGVFYAEEVTL